MNAEFNYEAAFSRNIGWVTEAEQAQIRGKRIAIAGMGGVGGTHLVTLARSGIGAFNIADFDTFDVVNFNRQVGATVSSVGRPKVDVLAEMALDINPELELRRYPNGVTVENLDEFLEGVDLYVDGLDFFSFPARRATFAACYRLGIPAVTAAPLGMGTAVLTFMPGQMSFEEYFCLDGCDEPEMAVRFMLGLAPGLLHRPYLADPSRVDLAAQRGPSMVAACQLCAGVTAVVALKILLARGDVCVVPRGFQFDAYRNRLIRTWRPGGNRNPLQRLAIWVARKQLSRMKGLGGGGE
jgi:molybdopterin/thiamine biosynthesis adenylyltransferase